jgi:hypothetical protein
MTTGAGTTGAVGDVLNLDSITTKEILYLELGGSPVGKTLKFDFGANFQGHKIKILATVQRTVVSIQKQKH